MLSVYSMMSYVWLLAYVSVLCAQCLHLWLVLFGKPVIFQIRSIHRTFLRSKVNYRPFWVVSKKEHFSSKAWIVPFFPSKALTIVPFGVWCIYTGKRVRLFGFRWYRTLIAKSGLKVVGLTLCACESCGCQINAIQTSYILRAMRMLFIIRAIRTPRLVGARFRYGKCVVYSPICSWSHVSQKET